MTPQTKDERRAEAQLRASRLGYNVRCAACGAPASEGCRGEDGQPQSAWVHTVRVGGAG